MSDAERTKDMSDAEVLEDLKTRRAQRSREQLLRDHPSWVIHPSRSSDWLLLAVGLLVLIGLMASLSFLTRLHGG